MVRASGSDMATPARGGFQETATTQRSTFRGDKPASSATNSPTGLRLYRKTRTCLQSPDFSEYETKLILHKVNSPPADFQKSKYRGFSTDGGYGARGIGSKAFPQPWKPVGRIDPARSGCGSRKRYRLARVILKVLPFTARRLGDRPPGRMAQADFSLDFSAGRALFLFFLQIMGNRRSDWPATGGSTRPFLSALARYVHYGSANKFFPWPSKEKPFEVKTQLAPKSVCSPRFHVSRQTSRCRGSQRFQAPRHSARPVVEPSHVEPAVEPATPAPLPPYLQLRSYFDRLFALLLLAIGSPLLLVLYLSVRLTSRGPVIYTQRRVGLNGRVFTLSKFRSMTVDAEQGTGAVWSQPGDPRVTQVGRFLRWSHLDELPQLLNILYGDMALIGPRPERPEIVEVLEQKVPGYRERLAVLPGVTGLAQVTLPPDSDLASVRRKTTLDRQYIETASFKLDLHIIFCTLMLVFNVQRRIDAQLWQSLA